jgi:hypothetical protein
LPSFLVLTAIPCAFWRWHIDDSDQGIGVAGLERDP